MSQIMETRRFRGFTLIELLVVISIITLLSSVVLASLNAAREKGRIGAGQLFFGSLEHAQGADAVGMWDFDEGTGSSTMNRAGYGTPATFTGGVSWSADTPFPQDKYSLLFDGSTGFATIPYTSQFAVSQSGFTLMAWVKPTTVAPSYEIFLAQTAYLYLGIQTAGVSFSMSAGGVQRNISAAAGTLSANKWYLLAASYDSSGYLKAYIDGKIVGTAGPYLNPDNAVTAWYLGQYVGGSYRFPGYMAQARFYNNGSLSDAEIQSIYAREAPRYSLAEK